MDTTNQTYDEFLAVNANGWVVVYIGKEKTPKAPIFVNVTGPFTTRQEATNRASAMRRRYKRQVLRDDPIGSDIVKISVRPLWNTDTEE